MIRYVINEGGGVKYLKIQNPLNVVYILCDVYGVTVNFPHLNVKR